MKRLFNVIYYILLGGIVVVALLLSTTFLPIPGNFQIKVVKSGSMEPAIMTGSIVIIKPESSYQVGDVVTFGADTKTQIPTTHRIVAISSDANPVYTTKGDANDAPDPVSTRLLDIHGKVWFSLPYLGYVLAFARTTLGFALLVGVPALAIILEELGKIVREIRALRRSRRPQDADSSSFQRLERSGRNPRNDHVQQNHTFTNILDLRR